MLEARDLVVLDILVEGVHHRVDGAVRTTMTVGGPVKCFGSFGSNFGFVAVGEGRSAHEVLLGLVSVNFTSIKVWIHREKFGLCQILNLV